mmetsp:Transcript_28449/g.59400  ORF Transcript_28449/g.59400 Transcript_28449/m.59400 type:complete len:93 (-) Transcript_28449:71-349(-)
MNFVDDALQAKLGVDHREFFAHGSGRPRNAAPNVGTSAARREPLGFLLPLMTLVRCCRLSPLRFSRRVYKCVEKRIQLKKSDTLETNSSEEY